MKQGKYLILLFLLTLIVLLFTACQTINKNGQNSSGESSAESSDLASSSDNPNEITVALYAYNDQYLRAAAKLYEDKTGIKVNIENDYLSSDLDSFDMMNPTQYGSRYKERALTELMARSGADIYELGLLDFVHLGKNGLLVDMSDWMENDISLTNEIVFRDILLSKKTEEGIFALPVDFGFYRLFATSGDEPLLPEKQMTWQEFFSKVGELGYTKDVAYFGTEFDIFSSRFSSRDSYFVSETGNAEGLCSDEMISLLEECKAWREMGFCFDFREYESAWSDYASTGHYPASYASGMGMNGLYYADALCTLPEEYYRSGYDKYYFAPVPYDGDPVKTDRGLRYPGACGTLTHFGMNAGSPKAEMAQDFLLFLLSEEAQDIMIDKKPRESKGLFFPVNRNVFRGIIERDLERVQVYLKTIELDFPALIDEAVEKVDDLVFLPPRTNFFALIYPAAQQYFLDEISAEEAARQMSDKVGLYLKEQG